MQHGLKKVGEFVPEMALWGGGKRARYSPLFVQKRLILSVGYRHIPSTAFMLASTTGRHCAEYEIFALKI